MDGIEWLQQLQKEIWVHHPPQYQCGRMSGYGWSEAKRRLTTDEWERIKQLIEELNLCCEPHNARSGFGMGMALHMCPPQPGTDSMFLIDLWDSHLPEPMGTRFEDGWEAFSPFTHALNNRALLKWCHKPPLREKSHYDY